MYKKIVPDNIDESKSVLSISMKENNPTGTQKNLSKTHDNKIKFEAHVLACLDHLYTAAIRLTNNAEKAEILVQDTLLDAFHEFTHFKNGSSFELWILKIMSYNFCQ